MDLQSYDPAQRETVLQLSSLDPVDPGRELLTLAFDAGLVPITLLEGLALRRLVVLEVEKPGPARLVVNAAGVRAC